MGGVCFLSKRYNAGSAPQTLIPQQAGPIHVKLAGPLGHRKDEVDFRSVVFSFSVFGYAEMTLQPFGNTTLVHFPEKA